MSFAFDARKEVMEGRLDNECCKIAFLSAVIHSGGELTKRGKEIFVEIKTDTELLFDIVSDCLNTLYGQTPSIRKDEYNNVNKSDRYVISLPKDITSRVLFDCGIARFNLDDDFSLISGLDEHILENECCVYSFIKGVFATSSTSNIVLDDGGKKRISGGYHYEFSLASADFADDLSGILFELGITNKRISRKNSQIVYIKEAEKVSDLLAIVGAFKSLLKLQNEMALRDVRNNVNRQTNCMNANITKTVNASVKQVKAIEYIRDTVGLDTLSDSLKELCLIRLENREESLENLTKMLSSPITKSGIYHKFDRIIKIAEKLKKKGKK